MTTARGLGRTNQRASSSPRRWMIRTQIPSYSADTCRRIERGNVPNSPGTATVTGH